MRIERNVIKGIAYNSEYASRYKQLVPYYAALNNPEKCFPNRVLRIVRYV